MAVGAVFHFLPPVLPVVIADLGIGHGQAGLLMSLFALPGIVISLPAGWLVDRFGERLVGGIGLLLMGAGAMLMSTVPGFLLILLARTLSGVGAMVGVVALQRLVTRLFQGRPLGLPMGISGSALPAGIVVVLNTAGPLAEADGWRAVAWLVGLAVLGVSLLFLLVAWFILRNRPLGAGTTGRTLATSAPGTSAADVPPYRQESVPDAGSIGRGLHAVWLAGGVWFCANGAMTAFMTFAPDHFLELGFGLQDRGLFTSIPMWGSALLGPVTGLLADRWNGRPAFIAWGMALLAAALAATPAQVISPVVIGLALGSGLALVVTPLLSHIGEVLPSSHHGRGFGILNTCANLGIFSVPPLTGLVRDGTGAYHWPFLIMASLAALGVVVAELLRRGRYLKGFGRSQSI